MRVLGIVPARGGSKGIPRKNIRPLLGKPLLYYTAEAAMGASRVSLTILSTDDPEIADVGLQCGLAVPFMRPPELARDDTPTLPVVQHVVRWVEEHSDGFEQYDTICLLQPTHPMRRSADIDACIDMLGRDNLDSVVTMLAVPPEHNPHWVYFQDEHGMMHISTGEPTPIPRRQELPPAFHREGSVYVVRRDVLMEENSLFGNRLGGYLIDAGRSVNIDGPSDWERAERLLPELLSAESASK